VYLDAQQAEVSERYADILEMISSRGLAFPVTVVGGETVDAGRVSFSSILRAVATRLSPQDS
jgi:disulfide oxidoreductase YuzD